MLTFTPRSVLGNKGKNTQLTYLLQRSLMRRNGVSEVDQCWRAGVPVTSIKVLPARRQIAAFVINPHFKSKNEGPAAEETSLP